MATAFPKYTDDEEAKLLPKNEAYTSFPLEVDQVDQKYANIRSTSSGNKVFQNFSKLALATVTLLIFVASYPYAIKFLSSSEPDSFFKKEGLPAGKPNFVFILLDDVGWNALGMNEYDVGFATPYLNNLFSKGITIENYYSQEMCTPARSALFTGRYPITIGMQYGAIGGKSETGLATSEILVTEVLKSHGYINYGLGKWNLGHYKAQHLPTARGFDHYLGYMDSANYYWAKVNPTYKDYYDFMYADLNCYNVYDGDDREDYSTDLYTAKAMDAIEEHDFSSPIFLYMAYQAAHEPFHDYEAYEDGLTADMVGTAQYDAVKSKVLGGERQQFALTLVKLDTAVFQLYQALHAKGQAENTYFIIASDNGGCYGSGGKNGPLRGSKGSLFEGNLNYVYCVWCNLTVCLRWY